MESMSIPFTEIAGQKLSSEQLDYLEGLFAGLKNRGLTFSDIEANPVGHPNGTAVGEKNIEASTYIWAWQCVYGCTFGAQWTATRCSIIFQI